MNRIEDVTNYITECDEEVGKALQLELDRQRRNLELIASENIVSPAVMLAMNCTDKQVCRRLSGKTLLWRMRGCRYS